MSNVSIRTVVVAVVALLLSGCLRDDCCGPPSLGFLRVFTVTTGANIDLDGFTLVATSQTVASDSATKPISVNESVVWALESTTHTVRLKGVQSNCMAAGDNPRTIAIFPGDTVMTTFVIGCP